MRFTLSMHPLVIAVLLCAMSTTHAAGVSRGAMLSNSCAGCHGTDGHSPGSIPSIKGKSKEFIVGALRDFRSGKRPSTVMGRHAKGYTDEEIELIGSHFSGQQ